MQFLHEFELDVLAGRILMFPALNGPALKAQTHCSPLDGGNLNRLFGDNAGKAPTASLARFMEQSILPQCDAVVDIHSGGKTSCYAPLNARVPHIAPIVR